MFYNEDFEFLMTEFNNNAYALRDYLEALDDDEVENTYGREAYDELMEAINVYIQENSKEEF